MNAETLKALKGSIKKWEKIAEGTGADRGPKNCPLCLLLWYEYNCAGCPVHEKTKEMNCEKTPYWEWEDHREAEHDGMTGKALCSECTRLAKKEVSFLKALLPKKKVGG